MQVRLSVLICTYNRAALLEQALEALARQTADATQYEVWVVDNNSSDSTAEVARKYTEEHPHFEYVCESRVGLSHARNTGFRQARAPWVAYLDDDARAHPDFVEQALRTIDEEDYAFFGGPDIPWYPFGRPRWYRDHYVDNQLPYSEVATLRPGEYAFGCLMVMRRDLLEEYGGFDPELGMRGTTVGYNEETDLQDRLRRAGIVIGWQPALRIDHAIAPHKLSLEWFFRAAFALGRDHVLSGKASAHPLALLGSAFILVGLAALSAPVNLLRWVLQSDYYVENFLIDTFRKSAKRVGIIYTGLLNRYGAEPS